MPDSSVTIVIPVFNREKYLDETIHSVLNQTFNHWELILVDDGSSDNSAEIGKKYQSSDSRIRFIPRESPLKGASVCRNIGLREAKYDWIIFLDSDDLLAPWCLLQRTEKLREVNYDMDFLAFPMLLFKTKPDDMMILQNINTEVHALDRFLQRENVWLMSSVIWRKKFLQSIGGYREEAMSFQDWEMNVRALIDTDKWCFYDKMIPDNFYRQHGETISISRFTLDHTCNNIETFIRCFGILIDSSRYTEQRRLYFAALIFEWLNRLGGISMEKRKRIDIWDKFIQQSISKKIHTENEAILVFDYLKRKNSGLANRFKIYNNYILRKYQNRLPIEFFNKIEKKQGKIPYKGALN
jgi:glycosyltransferase involved in cell wall biosynthesis